MVKLIIKFVIIFVCNLIAGLINASNADRIGNYIGIFLNIILALYAFDYYFSNISGTDVYYKMWWLSAIFMTQAGYYIALSVSRTNNFKYLARKFWLSMLPIYIFTFLITFARTPNTYYSLNLELGQGLIATFDYMVSNFSGNSWPLFTFVGNVAFFIPIPFIINALFKRIKYVYIIPLSVIVPFLVEGYQYVFKCGSVDIDDLLFNMSGVVLGLIALALENALHKNRKGY
ncbi:MAG: VanZ family protein [Clostridiales bacterium]|nr:VanZ family protein [Clostridiales bacterium]